MRLLRGALLSDTALSLLHDPNPPRSHALESVHSLVLESYPTSSAPWGMDPMLYSCC